MAATTTAWPIADAVLTTTLLDLVQRASHLHQIRKGANEATKSLNRGTAELVILAADTAPLAILMHFPLVSEDKDVPYVFVPSGMALGRALGVSRQVIATAVTSNGASDIDGDVQVARDMVERIGI
ncbi:ribonucleo protein-associated protein [Bimuria novae-zelandiae CBS 107.79]|uniref:H/ACA ribonucleoprotein complex subunit 2 n=1 Tax=Bimuria novae-zelandiae CBS 107.79 TaxID=1447943 RepID=A0A6A5V9U2_9PLEO|nr:ribonucleo protein-associated protein [Bimuria novae-zelandiae CBS 107.79]